MLLPKNILSGTYTKPRLFLCETDKTKICGLETYDTNGSFKFNSYSELNFNVGRYYTDIISGQNIVNPFYDKIEALRLVKLDGFGYFEIQEPELSSDGIKEYKAITAYSLEYTLSQKYLKNLYINTGAINSVEVIYADSNANDYIIPITLYNKNNPELSLLDLILKDIYGWSIGHVDASLCTLSRTFEIERQSVYDFIMNEICAKFNCYVVFDTENNTINFYAEALTSKFIGDGNTNVFIISPAYSSIGTVTVDGYKTNAYIYDSSIGALTFNNAPESGARIEVTDGSQEQWETDVYITFDNLAQQIQVSYSADDIKTVLTVKGQDDFNIREVNMGLDYITDLSFYYTVDWMGQDLYDAYTKYLTLCNSSRATYTQNAQEMLLIADEIWYLQNRLSLEYSEADFVDATTVGTYYVRGGESGNYYYTEVSLPMDYIAETQYYTLSGNDLTEEKISDLYMALRSYFKTGSLTELDALSDDFSFMDSPHTIAELSVGLSGATTIEDKDSLILDFLDVMWEQYGQFMLESYKTYFNEIQSVNTEWSNINHENYGFWYASYLMLTSVDREISDRQEQIQELQDQYKNMQNTNVDISNTLLMQNNFTEGQLIRLSAFLREDEYSDDQFAETSQDSIADIFKLKQELLECGQIELNKLCQPTLAFSMSMANIYALPEFAPIMHQFQLGKLIKVGLRSDYIKRSRLMQVNINFENFDDFSCEFGELTSLRNPSDIHADLLSQAVSAGKSVASNASYWDKGTEQATETDLKIQQGLLDAATAIKSIDGTQNVSIDQYGIHLQKVNSVTGEVDPKQGWIVNNQFLYSDDGFKTTKSVFGEFGDGQWGLLAEAVIAGYIEGSTMVGGTIDIGNGSFKVDEYGNVTMNGGVTLPGNGKMIYTSRPDTYQVDDIWILNDGEVCGSFGAGSVLRATVDSSSFNESHWQDAQSATTETLTNVRESFTWNADGIQVAKTVVDNEGNASKPFYVQIESERMGFHSVSKDSGDVEVVHIGNNSATIKNATLEGEKGATFNTHAEFNNITEFHDRVDICQTQEINGEEQISGFRSQIESNGSFSFVVIE